MSTFSAGASHLTLTWVNGRGVWERRLPGIASQRGG